MAFPEVVDDNFIETGQSSADYLYGASTILGIVAGLQRKRLGISEIGLDLPPLGAD